MRDRPQQDVRGYCRQRRPFTHEHLLRDGSRIQGTGSRLPEIRYRKGMVGIKGHRSVGGFRASCYNAMPKESVQALIDCMQEFEKLH